jgi:hypothetical protein
MRLKLFVGGSIDVKETPQGLVLMVWCFGKQRSREQHRTETPPPDRWPHERQVESRAMRRHDAAFASPPQMLESPSEARCATHHVVGDAMDRSRMRWNGDTRVY